MFVWLQQLLDEQGKDDPATFKNKQLLQKLLQEDEEGTQAVKTITILKSLN